jgi:hypothetical protein
MALRSATDMPTGQIFEIVWKTFYSKPRGPVFFVEKNNFVFWRGLNINI